MLEVHIFFNFLQEMPEKFIIFTQYCEFMHEMPVIHKFCEFSAGNARSSYFFNFLQEIPEKVIIFTQYCEFSAGNARS